MTVATLSLEQQFVLDDVGWDFYESILKQVGDRHIFVTYDQGTLELMSPSFKHDKRGRLLGLLINVVAEELGIPMQGAGSTTFRRKELERGLEPDQCFYVQNVKRIIGKGKINLKIDPPPDLAIEVEISRRMVKRLPIYEALGVPEIWRDDGRRVRVFVLNDEGHYEQTTSSPSFPALPVDQINQLVSLADETDEMNWMRRVRHWVKSNLVK